MTEIDVTDENERRDLIVTYPAAECIGLKGYWWASSCDTQAYPSDCYFEFDNFTWTIVSSRLNRTGYVLFASKSSLQYYQELAHKRTTLVYESHSTLAYEYYRGNAACYRLKKAAGFRVQANWSGCQTSSPQSDRNNRLGQTAVRVATSDPNINPDDPVRWYEVGIEVGDVPTISYRDVSLNQLIAEADYEYWQTPWHRICSVREENGTSVGVMISPVTIDFEVMSGKLIISIPAYSSVPIIVPLDNTNNTSTTGRTLTSEQALHAVWVNSTATTYTQNSTSWLDYLRLTLWIRKYKTPGVWESADHQLGFAPLNNPSFTYDYGGALPASTSVAATLIEPVTAKYQLTLSGTTTNTLDGQTYCDFTPTVRAVNFSYAMLSRQYWGIPTIIQPEQLSIKHNFDYNSLQIHSNASLTFNNNRGQFSSFFNNAGQNAVDIGIESSHIMPGIQMQAFSGIGNRVSSMRGAHGSSMFTMECFDRSCQLENPRWALPWMDGWNEFYAQYYLSQLGGIHPDQMGYAAYIPADPFNVDLGDEYGNPAWYLPVGTAGTALTRFSGVNLWEIKSRLAFAAGKMLYFDAYGREQYRKFLGPATFVKRTFFEDDSSGYPLGCHTLSLHRSLEDVRNQVTVVGVDAFGPLWNPIVSHYSDDASINDPNAFNHIGYSQPIVWADSMFANSAFAEAAAQRLISFLRLPTLHVHFTTWLNPDIYPLDTIGVDAPRFGIAGLRFMVVSVSHHLDEGSFGSTSITARWMGN